MWQARQMSIALRKQYVSRPELSFGPLRFIECLPWLVLAAGMRVIAFSGGVIALPAIFVATVAVLLAFQVTARRSIELADGETHLGAMTFEDEFRLSLRILARIGALMLVASMISVSLGISPLDLNFMGGIDGMAFDQPTAAGKIWNASIATLILLMIVGVERHDNRVRFFAACREFARRRAWLGVGLLVLTAAYFGLGFVQGLVRNAIAIYGQAPTTNTFIRNLIFFVFIFSFAMLRLWVTLMILTAALKQSHLRGD